MSPDTPAADTPPDGLSRRRLMRQAAAAGVAGLAATIVTGASTGTAAAAENAPAAADTHLAPVTAHDEPVIVHVRDIRSGHLDLFSGERHQRVQDPKLAAALVRALA
ncbi:hypothetical protein PUR71_06635 [Streptomyces sp. SP17BM10]|uniref:hypothetical protein n=1 Tax=Streptomyces sp. SP17BM10 TaxID=3002530 RepID=UPI002E77212E|nr:hypothetical protein [Streptomyces sp. SP17BM10]MEE1782598.1 hypothetical protein [Streptomyces sp. SP17BM10]